jgi:L-fuconolactonase
VTIDAHQHFWRYNAAEFGWLDDSLAALRRDFLPAELAATGIQATIAVQARQCMAETEWLLQLADRHPFIRGVVGWLPLTSPRLMIPSHPKLKGVRHVVQAEPEGFLDRPDFNRGVSALKRFRLVYDILIYERQLPEAIRFVDRHPQQIFVLDHIAKPRIQHNVLEPWATHIRELARRPHVFCKLSGMVTEADHQRWTEAQLRPYFDVVLEAFGPRRLMYGSDWPVCLVACDYARWQRIVAELSPGERHRILGGTAAEVYRL